MRNTITTVIPGGLAHYPQKIAKNQFVFRTPVEAIRHSLLKGGDAEGRLLRGQTVKSWWEVRQYGPIEVIKLRQVDEPTALRCVDLPRVCLDTLSDISHLVVSGHIYRYFGPEGTVRVAVGRQWTASEIQAQLRDRFGSVTIEESDHSIAVTFTRASYALAASETTLFPVAEVHGPQVTISKRYYDRLRLSLGSVLRRRYIVLGKHEDNPQVFDTKTKTLRILSL